MGRKAELRPLRIFFLPLMSPGHMIPMLDIAKLFARRGPDVVSGTVITTPANEPLVRASISSLPIELLLVPFPSSVAHLLRDGSENFTSLTFSDLPDFYIAFSALQQPIEDILYARRPDCIVSDYLFAWTADTALKLNVPRIVFDGHGIFTSFVHDSLERHAPYARVADDSEVFNVEELPHPHRHRIELTKSEVSLGVIYGTPALRESVEKSYGVIINSFYGLEPEYAELYRNSGRRRRRAYYVGPVSLSNADADADAEQYQLDSKATWAWLDSMEKGSVVYVCFGSLSVLSADVLREIAIGMEESGWPFVWAVKNDEMAGWLPEGFDERVRGKGVVIRGWAPQIAILNHPAVGGFVTHCGWNSTLESVSAGVPMVAWPLEWDQFVNEKLIVQVLEIGVSIGRGELENGKKIVKARKIVKAVRDVMGDGEEAEARRARVKKYAAMAKAAMEEGGSSYMDVIRLIQDIREHSVAK